MSIKIRKLIKDMGFNATDIWIWLNGSENSGKSFNFCLVFSVCKVRKVIGTLSFGIKMNIWKFMVHISLKPGLENFQHYFTSMWDECNCSVVWAFFGIAFLWDWNENWAFPVLWPLLSFPNLLAYWVQHFHSIIFQDLE